MNVYSRIWLVCSVIWGYHWFTGGTTFEGVVFGICIIVFVLLGIGE